MRKAIIIILLVVLCSTTVYAMEISAPPAPETAQEFLPRESTTFGEDLWYIIKKATRAINPDLAESGSVCVCLIGVCLLVSIVSGYTKAGSRTPELVGTISVGLILLKPTGTFIQLGIETVTKLCEYGKLLLPAMTTALAAEGGVTTATGLYIGTVFLNTFLVSAITKVLIPMTYMYLAMSVASSAVGGDILNNLQKFIMWLMSWSLKITLYIFTGYIGITGVVSGTVDGASIKAAKLALSGFVPVVGGVISDASETILVSAGIMKNSAGIYGILAMIALCIAPFLKIGVQYILLKLTGAVCGALGTKTPVKLIENFTSTMGILLAATGSVCLLHLVSTVCFMKGVG